MIGVANYAIYMATIDYMGMSHLSVHHCNPRLSPLSSLRTLYTH